MKNIIKSLVIVFAVAAVASVATYAYFSSQASVTGNTFSTGTLQIRVNSAPTIAGFNFTNAAPGDKTESTFTLMNYGPTGFPSGPSTLAAKRIYAQAVKAAPTDDALYNVLRVKLFANAGWSGCSNAGVVFVPSYGCTVYDGLLATMPNSDVLHATQWGATPSLAAGSSLTMKMVVEFPDDGTDQSALQGKSAKFDLVLNAYNP